MALITAMIRLAALAVSPVWMRHGCRFVRGLKQNHKQQPSQLFPGDFGLAGRTADLWGTWAAPGVLSAAAFTSYSASARRRLPAAVVVAVRGLNTICGRYMQTFAKYCHLCSVSR